MNTAKINDPCKQCDPVIFERCLDVYKVAGMPPCAKRSVENCHSLRQIKAEIAEIVDRRAQTNAARGLNAEGRCGKQLIQKGDSMPKIVIDTTNVSREEVQKLKEYLEENCWSWFGDPIDDEASNNGDYIMKYEVRFYNANPQQNSQYSCGNIREAKAQMRATELQTRLYAAGTYIAYCDGNGRVINLGMTKATRRFYAQSDWTVKSGEYSAGFCNTKSVKSFSSKALRDAFLSSTTDLSAKPLTRAAALKLARHSKSEYRECQCCICRPDLH